MTEVTNALLKKLYPEITAALKEIGDKYNVDLTAGGGTYGGRGGYSGSVKVEVLSRDTANGLSIAQAEFERYCHLYGFEKSDFNLKFRFRGKDYRLKGFNLNAPKNCLSIENEHDGKTYGMSKSLFKDEAIRLTPPKQDKAAA